MTTPSTLIADGMRFRVKGSIHNNFKKVFKDGEIGTLERAESAGDLWNLRSAHNGVRCESAATFQEWIRAGILVKVETLRMSVPIEGGKYTITQDEAYKVSILRGDRPWIDDPPGSKMLISIAYELACLRRIVGAAVKLDDAIKDPRVDPSALLDTLSEAIQTAQTFTDIRQNLDNPGEI